MQIEVNADAVLAGPANDPQNILPAHLSEEWLADVRSVGRVIRTNVAPNFDGPERYGQANPVETSSSNLRDVLLGNERRVVLDKEVGEVSGPMKVETRERVRYVV